MKSSLAALALLASAAATYNFPRDHFSHPEFQTEWWYYTGNLQTPDRGRFGFELTFFRQSNHLSPEQIAETSATWRPDQIYLAHLALTDIDGREFFHTERMTRAGPGLAGATLEDRRYWNGNWEVQWTSPERGTQHLRAVSDRFTLDLNLTPEKPFVVHGQNGLSIKGPRPGDYSHYISNTRLAASGTLRGWRGRDDQLQARPWSW